LVRVFNREGAKARRFWGLGTAGEHDATDTVAKQRDVECDEEAEGA
jgi:hypothetical protein